MSTAYFWTEAVTPTVPTIIDNKVKTLAVTGGIGSGKSYIVKIFSAMGVPVYDADSRTKQLYGTDGVLLEKLKSILGENLVRNGILDRQYMASRIFSDSRLLSDVEAVVFPRVINDFSLWRDRQERIAPFVVMESAIYLEKPVLAGMADRTLSVLCPESIREKRVMVRSGMSLEQVRERMKNQWTDARRASYSDYVIVSDFRHPLLPQVYDVYIKMKDNL